ncbi:MAG TPA: glutathione S-transferase C-terminal domain-containing protein, partial [Kofleriaceae bacterium]
AIDVMEGHLGGHAWFTGECYGIADIALFAYTQSAAAIGFAVGPGVGGWLDRVRAQPGHVPIKVDPTRA